MIEKNQMKTDKFPLRMLIGLELQALFSVIKFPVLL